MSLTTQLALMSDKQLHKLYNVMLEAGIAFETGGDWREIFRIAKNKHHGLQGRVYALLYSANRDEIDNLTKRLTDPMNTRILTEREQEVFLWLGGYSNFTEAL